MEHREARAFSEEDTQRSNEARKYSEVFTNNLKEIHNFSQVILKNSQVFPKSLEEFPKSLKVVENSVGVLRKDLKEIHDFVPDQNLDMVEWLDNFLVYTSVSPATVGLTAADINALTSVRDNLRGALTDLNAARSAYDGMVITKRTARSAADTTARQVVRKLQTNPILPDSLRANLQVPLKEAATAQNGPQPPAKLTVVGDSTGEHKLEWDRNGNAFGTQFLIEARQGNSGEWTPVDVVTASKFRHQNQKPGAPIAYRVRARRSRTLSAPSNEAALYL